ncbi:unnamed protein product, partial [Porites lobata]
ILVYGSSLVSCKRQKPKHDEIERVIDKTHSVIWKCSVSECHPGSGLSFPCGVSIPFSESIECVYCVKGANYSETNDYSQCKSCRKCSPHEKSSGHCTTTEDTTRCLKICNKGFYWNNITDSCDPCSDCCRQPLTHHEQQCEDSGLPMSHQCRQSHLECQHPTGTFKIDGKLLTILQDRMDTFRTSSKCPSKKRQFLDDYRLLGEKIGLSRDEITLLGQKGQPTHCMLQKFKSQKNSCVGRFKNIMEDMDRHDIVTIIDEWISFEWGKENNQAPH